MVVVKPDFPPSDLWIFGLGRGTIGDAKIGGWSRFSPRDAVFPTVMRRWKRRPRRQLSGFRVGRGRSCQEVASGNSSRDRRRSRFFDAAGDGLPIMQIRPTAASVSRGSDGSHSDVAFDRIVQRRDVAWGPLAHASGFHFLRRCVRGQRTPLAAGRFSQYLDGDFGSLSL